MASVGRDDSLDELIWQDAAAVAEVDPVYNAIHENNVLPYFAKSPFSSNLSKNKILLDQNEYNIVQDREHFEAELKRREGLEYIVAYGPKDFGGKEAPLGFGRWVIRKQNRTRNPNPNIKWDVEVLDTYFVIGYYILQAPRVADILWSRTMGAAAAVQRLLDCASDLASFTPAWGHYYVSPALKAAAKPPGTMTGSGSMVGTPLPDTSREQTPAASSQHQREASTAPGGSAVNPSSISDHTDIATLRESFNQFLRYGNEYMDENPLVGEPGSFTFSTTQQKLQARSEAARRALEGSKVKAEAVSKPSTPQLAPTAPIPIPNERPAEQMKPKLKRRKSRAPTSPSSPLARASSPGSPSS